MSTTVTVTRPRAGHAHEHAPGRSPGPQLHAARAGPRARASASVTEPREVVPRHAPPLPLRLGGEHASSYSPHSVTREPRNLPRGVEVGLVGDDLRLDHPGSSPSATMTSGTRRAVRAGARRLDRVAEHVVAVDPDLQRRAPVIHRRCGSSGARVGIQRARNAEDVKAVLGTRGLQRALVLSPRWSS